MSSSSRSSKPSNDPWDKESILKHLAQVNRDPKKGVMDVSEKLFYKVDERGKNSFTVLLNDLEVDWIKDSVYWTTAKAKPEFAKDYDKDVSVAQLRNVCWLDISGKLKADLLSRDTRYKIVLEVKLEQDNLSLDRLQFKIKFPGGKDDVHVDIKNGLKVGQWGTVKLYNLEEWEVNRGGDFEFCLYSHSSVWKRGFVLGGITFKPKRHPPRR